MTFWLNFKRPGKVSFNVADTGRPFQRGIGKVSRDPVTPFGGAGALTMAWTDSGQDSVNRTTYTFAAKSLGAAASDRIIVVTVTGTGGSAAVVSSLTVAGTAATQVVASTQDSETIAYIFQASVASGTTGDVVVNWDGAGKGNCAVDVYRLTGASSTVTDTFNNNVNPGSETITVSAGGAAIAAYVSRDATDRTFTWTGLTKDTDRTVEAGAQTTTAASATFATAQAALTVECTPSGTTTNEGFVGASWAPA